MGTPAALNLTGKKREPELWLGRKKVAASLLYLRWDADVKMGWDIRDPGASVALLFTVKIRSYQTPSSSVSQATF